MLKTLTPVEPELVRLCRSKKWVSMACRCESHPHEAEPTRLALQGAGTTALAIAVRSGAPIGAIRALVQASVNQLSIVHHFSGTILHEALKHRAPYNVLQYLLQSVIHHERVHSHGCGDTEHLGLLGKRDQQERNVLHNMVVRAMRCIEDGDGDREGMYIMFRSLLLAYPQAISEMDRDGNSPLVLALLIPGFDNSVRNEQDEAYVHRMVQLMVTTCPVAATVSQNVTAHNQWKRQGEQTDCDSPKPRGSGAPTPLTYAILYGRSERTVQLLLEAHRKVGANPCLTLASGYREVPLHLAITMRSPPSLVQDLIEYDPSSIQVRDMHNLTPLDWVWIRHVLDWCATEDTPSIMPSMRRLLPSFFTGYHDRTVKEMQGENSGTKSVLLDSLLERMRLFLPAAARVLIKKESMLEQQDQEWSLLHSACAVSCPLVVVRLACSTDKKNLAIPDVRTGRLPLHYAAARGGYRLTVPVGVSRDLRTLSEPSPALQVARMFVQATRVADGYNQLPLHIAIDTAKREDEDEATVVAELLRLYPDSLERRDGKTNLFPFLQAACSPNASLNMTFLLLHKNPTLVSSAIEF